MKNVDGLKEVQLLNSALELTSSPPQKGSMIGAQIVKYYTPRKCTYIHKYIKTPKLTEVGGEGVV
jgi:hypothetical protein